MGAEVLFCGVATVDFMFWVDAMPRTAEKHRASDVAIVGGGCAANAAVACARLGGAARLAGRLGDDAIGDLVLADLTREGVDCAAMRRFPGGRSAYSSIYVDPAGERQIVNFRGDGLDGAPDWIEIGGAKAVLTDTRWPAGATHVLRLARAAGAPGVLDGEAPVDREAAETASHVAFSRQGLEDFAPGPDPLAAAAARLSAWICVTDGADGVTVAGGPRLPAPAVKVVDTLGAGDVWHGAFALRLAEGAEEIEAARFANAAASLKCRAKGGRTGAPSRAEVEEFIKRTPA